MFNRIAFNKLLFQYIFFKVSEKKNKNTANSYTCYEIYNKKYYLHCVGTTFTRTIHFFCNHLELNYKSSYLEVVLSYQYFHYILRLIYQLTFSTLAVFYNLNILQHHMIYQIHIHNC